MKTSIDIIDAPSNKETHIEVTNNSSELESHPDIEELREKAAKVLGERAAKSLSMEDFVRVIGKDQVAEMSRIESKVMQETEGSPESTLPADFDDYDYDTLEAQAKAGAELEPLRAGVSERLGFSWVKGAGLYANAVMFGGALKERRDARLEAKLKNKTMEEQLEFLDKWGQRQARLKKIGAYTIGLGLTAWTFKAGADSMLPMFLDGGNQSGAPKLPGEGFTPDSQEPRSDGVALMNEEKPLDPTALDKAVLKTYNNSDASFYDYGNKTFRGDFGPAVKASANDGMYGAGFSDWMSRNKHEPNGLANLVSGLKLEGHGDTLADRNNLANIYDNDKMAHAKADLLVQAELRNPDKFRIETTDINFKYNTTYMVDVNGDPVIATQANTDHGGTAFKITNKATGEVTYWRKECGAYQQIWPIHEAPVKKSTFVETPTYRPRGGSTPQYESNPTPTRRTPPTTSTPPSTPETPETPVTPPTEPPIDNPPVTPPLEHKQDRGPDHEKKSQLDSGPLTPAFPVQTGVDTSTGRDIGGGRAEAPVRDTVTNQQGTQSGAESRAPGVTRDRQNTSSNGQSGGGVGDGDTSGSTNNSDPGSR